MICTDPARTGALPTVMQALLLSVLLMAIQGCGSDRVPEVALRGDRFDPVRGLIAEAFRSHNISSIAVAAVRDLLQRLTGRLLALELRFILVAWRGRRPDTVEICTWRAQGIGAIAKLS